MKTSEKENERAMEMSSKKIFIPSTLASRVLQQLQKRQIRCHYVGIDPSGRIIMRVYYVFSPKTELFLLTLEQEIGESEKLLDFLVTLGAKMAEDAFEELILKALRAKKSPRYGVAFLR